MPGDARMELGDRLSVVILTHNRVEEAARTVERMRPLPERLPLVVIDNASTDRTPILLKHRFPGLEVIALSRNLGAAGRNAGVRAVATPLSHSAMMTLGGRLGRSRTPPRCSTLIRTSRCCRRGSWWGPRSGKTLPAPSWPRAPCLPRAC
jgi:hypothetical protein